VDELVSYSFRDGIATITMDDGKVNALSPAMQAQVGAALDRATADDAVVLLAGRPGVWSAGFDLKVLRAGGPQAQAMLRGGFELAARMLAHPRPVIIGCTGHAIAMGSFLLLSGDYRIGAAGPYKIQANEVAIGLTLPRAAVEICRQRLTPAAFSRAAVLAEVFTPADAVQAGFLDRVVGESELPDAAWQLAKQVRGLDMAAHATTKLRVRENVLAAIPAAIKEDYGEVVHT
jgi:enoyl-CoA hydratase